MYSKFFTFLLFFLFLGVLPCCFAQTWEEALLSSEILFQQGNYKPALKAIEKSAKKLGNSEKFAVWNSIQKAKINTVLGEYTALEANLAEAKSLLSNLKSNDFEAYCIAQSKLAEVEIYQGRTNDAAQRLDSLLAEIKRVGSAGDYAQTLPLFYLAKAKAQQGFFEEANQHRNNFQTQMSGLVAQTDNKKAARLRQTLWLESFVLEAEILKIKGDYETGSMALSEIRTNNKKDFAKSAWANMQAGKLTGDLFWEQGEVKEAKKAYEKTLKKAKLSKSSAVYLEIYDALLHCYYEGRNLKQIKDALEYRGKIMYAFYRGKNAFQWQNDLMQAEFDIRQGRYVKAEKQLSKAYEEAYQVLPVQHPLMVAMLKKLYELHSYKGSNWDAAQKDIETFTEAERAMLGDQSPIFKLSEINYGVFLLQQTDAIEQGKKIFESRPQDLVEKTFALSHRRYLTFINNIVDYYTIAESYDSALVKAQQGFNITQTYLEETHPSVGKQLAVLANAQIQVGKYREASENVALSLEKLRKSLSKRSIEYADALSTSAKIYGLMSQYDEAETLLKNASRINQRLRLDISQSAKSIEELAFLYIRIGEYANTEELLNKAISRKEEKFGKESQTLINPLTQMGQFNLIVGNYREAGRNLSRAAQIASRTFGEKTLKYAQIQVLQADLFAAIGDFDRAEETIKQVIALQEEKLGTNHIELANSYKSLALILFNKSAENLSEAESLLNKASTIIAANFDDNHPLYAEALKNKAALYIEVNKLAEASTLLDQANAIWKTKFGEYNRQSAEVAMLQGDIASKQQAFSQAEAQYVLAKTIYGSIFSEEHPNYVKTLSKQAEMYFMSGAYGEARKASEKTLDTYLKFLSSYFPTLSENEKSRFWDLMRPDFEFYNTLAVLQGGVDPELLVNMYKYTLATKAILLNSSIKLRENILNSGNEALITQFKEWIAQKEFLTSALSMSEAQLKEEGIKINDIVKKVEKLEKTLSENSELFSQGNTVASVGWLDVQKALSADEAAIEMVRFRLFQQGVLSDSVLYAALLVKPTTKKSPELLVLNNGKRMEKQYLAYYRNVTKNDRADEYSYGVFWKPIEEKLENFTQIYLSPDGVYNQVNVEAFLTEGNNYVIDKYNVMLVSNTKDVALAAQRTEKIAKGQMTAPVIEDKALLVGNPAFYEAMATGKLDKKQLQESMRGGAYIDELPGTAIEINEIEGLLKQAGWQIQKLEEVNASEEKLKTIQNPRVFHIATHGFFLSNPEKQSTTANNLAQNPLLRSGLLLEGAGDVLAKSSVNYNLEPGVLTAAEAMNLPLDNTELVILSACETGLGDIQFGEGVFGLQRSFLVAGAGSLVMSLFKVSDEVTQKLMVQFYQNWLQSGDKRQAFREAKLAIKTQFSQPRFWGAFNMIGTE